MGVTYTEMPLDVLAANREIFAYLGYLTCEARISTSTKVPSLCCILSAETSESTACFLSLSCEL